MSEPVRCRFPAWKLFKAQLPVLEESSDALLRAAIAISLHELTDVDPQSVEATIDGYAEEIRKRSQKGSSRSHLAHLHEYLFDDLGFRGNVEDYYNPGNSYLPVVMETKLGLPITLTLLYKCVGDRLGLEIRGVNAPAHFLAAVVDRKTRMLVDPFYGGRVISEEEVYARIEKVSGGEVPRTPGLLSIASHREWIARILRNLRKVFASQGRLGDMGAMTELSLLFEPSE